MTDLAALAAEVVAAVERLIAEGRSERVVVHVNPALRRVVVAPPDGEMVLIHLEPLGKVA